MKKLVSALLVIVMLMSLVCVASAEEQTQAPKYKLVNVQYDDMNVTGELVLERGTPVEGTIKVKTAFYITGQVYVAVTNKMKTNTFDITAYGTIKYITVMVFTVDESGKTQRLAVAELFV